MKTEFQISMKSMVLAFVWVAVSMMAWMSDLDSRGVFAVAVDSMRFIGPFAAIGALFKNARVGIVAGALFAIPWVIARVAIQGWQWSC